MKKTITICSLILGVLCLGCSKESTTAPTADRFTISIAENEKGIVDPHGDFTVQRADSINIKAKNSRDGYRFLKWQITNGSNNISVRDTAGDSTYVADIAGDAEIEAVFARDTFDIIVTSDAFGSALVEDTFKVAYNESLAITAGQPINGYKFSHWATGGDPQFQIETPTDSITIVNNVKGNGVITCTFTPRTYTLSIGASSPVAGGTVVGSSPGTYNYGDRINLTAEPNLGWRLTGWSGVGETGQSISFQIFEDMSVTANFDTIGVDSGVICVRYDAPQNGPGTLGSNWVMAYQTLHEAVEEASEDGEIWVARGTYYNNGERYEMKPGISLYGGFNGDESEISQRGAGNDRWYKNLTILDGEQSSNRILFLFDATNFTNVNDVTIDGFLIRGAVQNSVYIRGNNNSIKNCILKDNNALGSSGPTAMYIWGIGNEVESCVFTNNLGNGGTALNINGVGTKIVNSLFLKNDGPAIADNNVDRSQPTKITTCTIWGNTTDVNNTPAGIDSRGNLDMKGTILYGNKNGNDTCSQIDTTYIVKACCVEMSNGVKVDYTNWYPNNTHDDPVFADTTIYIDDSEWYKENVNNSAFMPTSSSVKNKVDINILTGDRPAYDLRNASRSSAGAFDMGCYEVP